MEFQFTSEKGQKNQKTFSLVTKMPFASSEYLLLSQRLVLFFLLMLNADKDFLVQILKLTLLVN